MAWNFRLACQRASRDLLVSASPLTVDGITAIPLCLTFDVGSGDPKSGFHTREVSMLLCEPLLQPSTV